MSWSGLASGVLPGSDMDKDAISVRTLFLSDLHLGFRYSRPKALLSFLRQFQPGQLYLVGDIIDGWCFQRDWHWLPECSELLHCLIDLSRRGTIIRVVIGNHDAFLRQSLFQALASNFERIELSREFDHRLPDGRRILVTHGDQFDPCEKLGRLSTSILSGLYKVLLQADRAGRIVFPEAHARGNTLLSFLKRASGGLAKHAYQFRRTASKYARCRGFHGIVCGHLHQPESVQSDGFIYFNTGDWVENCSGLIEDLDGQLHLLKNGHLVQNLQGGISSVLRNSFIFR